jgi:hypothetical protein
MRHCQSLYSVLQATMASGRVRLATGGRREDRKVGVAARGAIEADLLIPYGCKLTAQETWWRTMREVVKSSSEDRTATLEAGRGPKLASVIVRVKGWNTFGQRDPRKF